MLLVAAQHLVFAQSECVGSLRMLKMTWLWLHCECCDQLLTELPPTCDMLPILERGIQDVCSQLCNFTLIIFQHASPSKPNQCNYNNSNNRMCNYSVHPAACDVDLICYSHSPGGFTMSHSSINMQCKRTYSDTIKLQFNFFSFCLYRCVLGVCPCSCC